MPRFVGGGRLPLGPVVLVACAVGMGCENRDEHLETKPTVRSDAIHVQPEPTPPEEAAASLVVPAGFHVSLFAAEPMVEQPIALATDPRGRIWVAENKTYDSMWRPFDLSRQDRIVILEDTDGDGRADRRTVFWDKAQRLTSVELGFGGVWALCPPKLLFIPDRNGDDKPDGEPEVVLDGFEGEPPAHHVVANGLRWGPDGWLYGRQGADCLSNVGVPGALPAQRIAFDCGIWRYHPIRKTFEVVCRGTSNPWGMDWNADGECFFVNTVVGHLWHAVPGAHFQRCWGNDGNPNLYELMGQTADHYHWDTAAAVNEIRKTGAPLATLPSNGHGPPTGALVYSYAWKDAPQDRFGGGHAHAGLMIYQGDNWPKAYRGTLFTVNVLGRRLNNDTLERRGSGYVGRHAADFLRSTSAWFQGVEVLSGSDGGVYISDWCDTGECHGNDGVHRKSGRIYKIVYGSSPRPTVSDVSRLSDLELVELQRSKNDWFSRQARHLLHQRSAEKRLTGGVRQALLTMFETGSDRVEKLRALWSLYVTEGVSDSWLVSNLAHKDEHVRAWVVRLLSDGKSLSPQATRALCSLAGRESSGLVLLYLASALQQLPTGDRWPLADELATHAELADDPAFPLMVWYGIEAAVPENPDHAVHLAGTTKLLRLVRFIARRLSENIVQNPQPVDRLVALARQSTDPERTIALLTGVAEALRGWSKAPMPASWSSAPTAFRAGTDDRVRRLVLELSVVFGDGRSLNELLRLVQQQSVDVGARRDALRVLVEAQFPPVMPVLKRLVDDLYLRCDAVRGLASFNDPSIPALLAGLLVDPIRQRVSPEITAPLVATLSSRPAWARTLLSAIASGQIERDNVHPFQVWQMLTFGDREIRQRIASLWPELKAVSGPKRAQIDRYQARLNPRSLAIADLPNGRRRFNQSCATCHILFGQGTRVGPDLTG
ncbi:MAG TPA: PVC-type heme-binding CxxCH protein, partial [Planctomycetaceae bacterium]|nr:PVC-type heme-binding CxxCH protein [Planctomycetaceae bacterium]